jgi:hypothetical protein
MLVKTRSCKKKGIFSTVLRIQIRSGAFLPPGSGIRIRDGAMVGSGSGISKPNLLIAFIQKEV